MARLLLLLPSSTYRAADFVAAARSLGAEIMIVSDHRLAIAPALDADSLVVDFSRPEGAAQRIVAHCRKEPVDAIVPVDDEGVLTAALAATALGLAQNPVAAVAATRDKAKLRRALTAAGLPQPSFHLVDGGQDAAGPASEVGWPCVLKPLSMAASRGVVRADDAAGTAAAAIRVRAIIEEARPDTRDPGEPLLIESYVPGAELALEGLLREGRLEVLALFDKPDPLVGPFFEETIYVTPSRLPTGIQRQIARRCAEAAAALGLSEGPVHAEVRLHDSEVWVIDMAARSIGGLCSRSLHFGLGVSLEELLLRHALSLPVEDLERGPGASGVMMLPIRELGALQEVRGVEEARGVPGIVGLEITVARGRRLRPLPEGDRYLGFLFASGATPEEVERALRRAHAELEVVIKPV
ncbi:MAG: ATP-grasp domain-containing protein [Actinomycetota bacterium]|nr:ATP-grasp domain-containing protein [Actinomycetota bacterium]